MSVMAHRADLAYRRDMFKDFPSRAGDTDRYGERVPQGRRREGQTCQSAYVVAQLLV